MWRWTPIHHGTVRIVRGGGVTARVALEQHQRGIDVRGRPEHVAADDAHAFRGAVPCELHARRAVDLRTGLLAQTVRHFLLHYHQEGAQIVETFQQGEQNRRGHVVRQIGHQREGIVILEIGRFGLCTGS